MYSERSRWIRGRAIGRDEDGYPLVQVDGEPRPRLAALVRPLTEADLDEAIDRGLPVLLALPGAGAEPHIVGVVAPPRAPGDPRSPICIEHEGERVVISAPRELLLRCGEASVLLTADGRVRVKGLDITTRARRSNRVFGGKVYLGE